MATLLPPAKRQFFDALGNPLAGGSVAYFIPSTSTPKNTWQDAGQSTLNTNPITLDAAGEALIYGSGTYRELVKDSLSNTIWDQVTDQPAVATDVQNSVSQWGGTSSGAANTYAITLPGPVPGSYLAGQTFRFTSHQTNTTGVTLNVNALGAKNITKSGATALASGDIINGEVVEVCYDGTQFELISPPGSLVLTVSTGLQSAGTVLSVDPSFLQGYLGGLTLSNDGVTPATILDIAAGVCVSDDATTLMKLASAFTKTTGAWAVGSGNGALDTGSIAINSSYAVFVIERLDTGVRDVIFTKAAAGSTPSPTMPSSYTKKRYVGSFRTDGSAAILAFQQNGDNFRWMTPPLDGNNVATTTTYANLALTVPLGIVVEAFGNANATGGIVVQIRPPFASDISPTNAASPLGTVAPGSAALAGGKWFCRTNTSAQVQWASSSNSNNYLTTEGWVDYRGRFS